MPLMCHTSQRTPRLIYAFTLPLFYVASRAAMAKRHDLAGKSFWLPDGLDCCHFATDEA